MTIRHNLRLENAGAENKRCCFFLYFFSYIFSSMVHSISHQARASITTLPNAPQLKCSNAATTASAVWNGYPDSGLSAQFVKVLDIGPRRAVNPLHLGIGRFDHIVFIRRMRSAAVTQAEMSCGQPQRIAGEDIAGP